MKKRDITFIWIIVLILAILLFTLLRNRSIVESEDNHSALRVIALIPSVAEIIAAAGGEKYLVAVSEHCVYPPSIKDLPVVAGYGGIDYEDILSLKPDIIFLSSVHSGEYEKLTELGLRCERLDDTSVSDIIHSISKTGEILGTSETARKNIDNITDSLDELKKKFTDRDETVLLMIGGSERLNNVYLAGNDNLFNEMIEMIGYENAYQGKIEYPKASPEDITEMAPDHVIYFSSERPEEEFRKSLIRSFEKILSGNTPDIHFIYGDHVFIPGPRFIRIIKDIAQSLE